MSMAGTDGIRLVELLEQILRSSAKSNLISQWLDFIDTQNKSLEKVLNTDNERLRSVFQEISLLIDDSRKKASNPSAPIPSRVAALNYLLRDKNEEVDLKILASLLSPQTEKPLQAAAIKTLITRNRPEGINQLLSEWRSYSPSVRADLANQLLTRSTSARALLQAIGSGTVASVDLGPAQKQQMIKHPDKGVAKLAAKLFAGATPSDRARIVQEYQPAIKLKGSSAKGRIAFMERCAVCHQLDGIGTPIGPDLRTLTDRSPESLLTAILDPSRNVEPAYLGYTASLANEESVYGIVTSETGNSVTMRLLDGTERNVLRREIRSMESSRLSFMPDGLEEGLNQQAMADLLAFLETTTAAKEE